MTNPMHGCYCWMNCVLTTHFQPLKLISHFLGDVCLLLCWHYLCYTFLWYCCWHLRFSGFCFLSIERSFVRTFIFNPNTFWTLGTFFFENAFNFNFNINTRSLDHFKIEIVVVVISVVFFSLTRHVGTRCVRRIKWYMCTNGAQFGYMNVPYLTHFDDKQWRNRAWHGNTTWYSSKLNAYSWLTSTDITSASATMFCNFCNHFRLQIVCVCLFGRQKPETPIKKQ